MEPQSSRWNRNYNKLSEYYFKWEIEVMEKPPVIYDIEAMMKIISIPKLEYVSPCVFN